MSTGKQSETQTPQPTLPLALLTKDRNCLVVGAGNTACRKAASLLEAGARVTVVAPSAPEDQLPFLSQKDLTWHQRPFEAGDVGGIFLVFAATNDPVTNQAILTAARSHGTLCGIVDHGWQEGDFISPAVFRQDEVTVAVSTGGKSCRRSRMIRESLSRHVQSANSADLLILGSSHEELPLSEREPLHLSRDQLERTGTMIAQVRGVFEFALLNTCNRVELYAVVSDNAETEPLLRRIIGFDALGSDQHYTLRGRDAFGHAARVLAGLRAQIPGENHIVAQVKEAFAFANGNGWADRMMKEWLASSLYVSRRIRDQTDALLNTVEIETVCMDYLLATHDKHPIRHLTLLGSGTIGRAIAERHLELSDDTTLLWGYHHTPPRLPEAWRSRVRLAPFDTIQNELKHSRTIVCAVAGPEPILHSDNAICFDHGESVHVVDLGVPRNVAPEIGSALPNVTVTDMDDLKRRRRHEPDVMTEAMRAAQQSIDKNEALYTKLVQGLREGR